MSMETLENSSHGPRPASSLKPKVLSRDQIKHLAEEASRFTNERLLAEDGCVDVKQSRKHYLSYRAVQLPGKGVPTRFDAGIHCLRILWRNLSLKRVVFGLSGLTVLLALVGLTWSSAIKSQEIGRLQRRVDNLDSQLKTMRLAQQVLLHSENIALRSPFGSKLIFTPQTISSLKESLRPVLLRGFRDDAEVNPILSIEQANARLTALTAPVNDELGIKETLAKTLMFRQIIGTDMVWLGKAGD